MHPAPMIYSSTHLPQVPESMQGMGYRELRSPRQGAGGGRCCWERSLARGLTTEQTAGRRVGLRCVLGGGEGGCWETEKPVPGQRDYVTLPGSAPGATAPVGSQGGVLSRSGIWKEQQMCCPSAPTPSALGLSLAPRVPSVPASPGCPSLPAPAPCSTQTRQPRGPPTTLRPPSSLPCWCWRLHVEGVPSGLTPNPWMPWDAPPPRAASRLPSPRLLGPSALCVLGEWGAGCARPGVGPSMCPLTPFPAGSCLACA